jgi:peptide/nickel transport system permease protein
MSASVLRVRPRGWIARRAADRPGPLGVASAIVIALAAVVAIVGPTLAPHDPDVGRLSDAFLGPNGEHLLGFDSQGRDLLSRLLVGARTTLVGPLYAVGIAVVAGTALAVFAAWRGGPVDSILSSALNVVFAFPAILIAILAVAMFDRGLTAASLALAVAYTPYIARVIRSAALRERAQPYVAALEVLGLPAIVICLRHLVPNLMSLIVAQATILYGLAVVDLAAISYLGLGVQPPQADWGVMVASGQSGVLQGFPAESLLAGSCIVVVVVAVNLLGERLAARAERRAR